MDISKDVEQHSVNGTGTVSPVSLSQLESCVGVHWLRISFPTKLLAVVVEFLKSVWGDFDQDGFGLWSYDTRFSWSSGVSLNYDEDQERSNRVHCGMMTLDCPGSSLDEMAALDLQLMIEYFQLLGGKCTRIDIFFDDYKRIISPIDVYEIAKNGDYSGFKTYNRRERGDRKNGMTYDEIAFGRRGSFGNGAYLRFYDKYLESKGEFNCCRWEVEFTQKKADAVFSKLAQTCGNIDAFATLCGSLIAGCVTFVHRNGDPNIKRLERYSWWENILEILGDCLHVRIERKKDSLTGKIKWITQGVSPTLACLRNVFVNDKAFFRWLFDQCHEGESRMNPFTEQIANDNEGTLNYQWGKFIEIDEAVYDKAMSQL
ncbi:hypothetical protein ES705_10635 [subsurface metagenome]